MVPQSYLVEYMGKQGASFPSTRMMTFFTRPNGKTMAQEPKAGQATWHEAGTHASESTGPVHALLIELKK